jgi:uncharacterized membrane protein
MEDQRKEQPKTDAKPTAPGTRTSPERRRMIFAVLAYVLFLIPLISGDAKKDEFVKYHTKQGFALFIVSLAIQILERALFWQFIFWIPILELLNLALLVLFILGIVNVANNKKEPLPVIGPIGDWLKI